MRGMVLALTAGFSLIATIASAGAAPIAVGDVAASFSNEAIVKVADGCGRGWHREGWRNQWGHWRSRCVPNRRW